MVFKKAFTDKTVFQCFVKDILGLTIQVGKIETKKRFYPKIGNIDFELDIYAETVDKRICIELQKVQYDYTHDRFLHYFMMLIADNNFLPKNMRLVKPPFKKSVAQSGS